MTVVKARSGRSRERERVYAPTGGISRVKRSFGPSTDVNNVVSKFLRTGVLPQKAAQPFYGDFSVADDYHSAMNRVMQIEDMFMSLPAKVRNRFSNNAEALLRFVGDVSNRDEAIELGLIDKPLVVGQDSRESTISAVSGSEQSST